MDEMKPCPFCGGSAETWHHHYPSGAAFWEPVCWHDENCILDGVLFENEYITESELIEAWNKRVGEHDA